MAMVGMEQVGALENRARSDNTANAICPAIVSDPAGRVAEIRHDGKIRHGPRRKVIEEGFQCWNSPQPFQEFATVRTDRRDGVTLLLDAGGADSPEHDAQQSTAAGRTLLQHVDSGRSVKAPIEDRSSGRDAADPLFAGATGRCDHRPWNRIDVIRGSRSPPLPSLPEATAISAADELSAGSADRRWTSGSLRCSASTILDRHTGSAMPRPRPTPTRAREQITVVLKCVSLENPV